MSKIITISDEKYQTIEALARAYGFPNVEQFIEEYEQFDEQLRERQQELERRRETGRRMRALRAEIFQKHGLMPDSTLLLREDRER